MSQAIVEMIDQEIIRLQSVRNLLANEEAKPAVIRSHRHFASNLTRRGPGRPPKGLPPAVPILDAVVKTPSTHGGFRGITPEGRKRLAESMKRRWADKRAAAKKMAKK